MYTIDNNINEYMTNKNILYPMREGYYKNGLEDLIDYVNKFSNTKEMVMIEIGSYAGESTELFAKNFKKVISIDPYINNYDQNDPACYYMDFNDVFKTFSNIISKYDNISHIKKISDEAINDLKDIKVDMKPLIMLMIKQKDNWIRLTDDKKITLVAS